jgi:transcriptional regulator of heat shock response
VGKEISQVGSAKVSDKEPIMGLCAEALAVLRQVAESVSHSDSDVCVEGTNYILRQPEFKDASKMDSVLELLEQRKELYQLLSRAILGPDVMIMI